MISNIDDIEKERRKKANKEVSEDITNIFEEVMFNVEDFFKRKDIAREKENRKNPLKIFKKGLRWLGLFGLLVLVLNFIFGNIWLFVKLIKSLFRIG